MRTTRNAAGSARHDGTPRALARARRAGRMDGITLTQASIDEAKQHPLANIVSAEGKTLQFALIEEGLRTVGAPAVGTSEFRTMTMTIYFKKKSYHKHINT